MLLGASDMSHLEDGWTVFAGKRTVTYERYFDRYKVYLPKGLNDLWSKLKGKKVKVYLVVDDS